MPSRFVHAALRSKTPVQKFTQIHGRTPRRTRLAADLLEDRCLPATFAGAGPTLTVTLDHPGEAIRVLSNGASYAVTSNFNAVQSGTDPTGGHVTGFGTTNARIDSSAYTGIAIQSASPNTSVTFADSGTNVYTAGFTVTLNHDQGVLFNGTSTFSGVPLTVKADGAITAAAGSSLDLSGSGGNLSLTSSANAIALNGTIDGDGTTILTSAGGPLSLGAINATQLVATAAGFITQSAPITATTASFTAQGNYGITLTNPANAIGTVSLNNPTADATAASAVQFINQGTVTLGNCAPGLGRFSITSVRGDIQETGAVTQAIGAGAVRFTAGGTTINLDTDNDFSGQVSFFGNHVTTVALENTDTQAAMPNLSGFSQVLNSLTLDFDNAPALLPSLTVDNLTVTANGVNSLNSASFLTVPGVANFNGRNFGVSLGFSSNQGHQSTFGTLELTSTGQAGDNVFATGPTRLGNINVGSGGLALVVLGGAITQSPNTQITHTGGLTTVIYGQKGVDLSSPSNDISGTLTMLDPSDNFPGNGIVDGNVTINAKSDLHLNIIQLTGNLTVDATAGEVRAEQLQVRGTTSITASKAKGPQAIDASSDSNLFGGAVSLSGSDVTINASTGIELGNCEATSLSVTANAGGFVLPPPPFSKGDITQAPGTLVSANQVTLNTNGFAANVNLAPNLINLTPAPPPASVTLALQTGSATSDSSTITVMSDVELAGISVAGGSLTINADGSITQVAGDSITQSGTGTVTLDASNGTQPVNLDSSAGVSFSTPVVVQGTDVTVNLAGGALSFGAKTAITGALNVTGDGTFTVSSPTGPFQVGSLDSSAINTTVESDLTAETGAITFEKPVQFVGSLTIQTSANSAVTFDDNVSTNAAMTFNTGTGPVILDGGTWNQGSNDLTLTGSLVLKTATDSAATLQLAGGSVLDFTGTSSTPVLTVDADSTLAVTGGPTPVTVQNGAGHVVFASGARLGVDFASSAQLITTGTGPVSIGGALLIGSGLANVMNTTILQAATAHIDGQFAGSSSGPFLAESDIVTATYDNPTSALVTAVQVAEAGAVAPGGVATGTLPNGDQYQVTASLGTSAGLVVIPAANNTIDVVVRSNSSGAATTSTLTLSATHGGSPTALFVGGLVVYGNTNVAIVAPGTSLQGDLLVNPGGGATPNGVLASLTIDDATGTDTFHPLLIEPGGTDTSTTSITGQAFQGVQINAVGTLSNLSLASFEPVQNGPASSASAQSFGTINIAGNLGARLSPSPSQGIGTVTVGGTLYGEWDLSGAIGTVIANSTNHWNLNNHKGTVNQIEINDAATDTTINAGSIDTLKAQSWTGGEIEFGSLTDGEIGSGGLNNATIESDGTNATAVQKLVIAGDVVQSNLSFPGGAVQSLEVDGNWLGSIFSGGAVGTMMFRGVVGSFTQGSTTTDSALTISATGGGQVVGLFQVDGPFLATDLSISQGSVGSLVFNGLVSQSSISVKTGATGSVDQISLPAGISGGSITVTNEIKHITSGPWISATLNVSIVGTFVVNGDLGSTAGTTVITSNANIGGKNAPLSFDSITVTGNIVGTNLTARNGIGSLAVGPNGTSGTITDSSIVVDNTDSDDTAVGEIQRMTSGTLSDVTMDANSLGTVTINGDVKNSNIFIGARNAAGVFDQEAIQNLTVTGDWTNTPLLTGLGWGTVRIEGLVANSGITVSHGPIRSFTVGEWLGSQLSADSIGSFIVAGNAARNLPGNFAAFGVTPSVLTLTSSTGSITTFEVDGNLQESLINVLPSVQTLRVTGAVQNDDLAIAYASGASIGTLSAALWQNTNLTTTAIGQWNVGGDFTGSLINITGSKAGVALKGFAAGGTVDQSTFQVAAGDVDSFVASQFDQSSLMAGYRLPRPFDVTAPATPESRYWTAELTIHHFATTGTSPSFVQSNVAAARLGTVSLSSVAPLVAAPTESYGVVFRQSAGPGGPIDVGGQTVFPGYRDGQFAYAAEGATLTAVTVPAVTVSAGQTTTLTASVTSAEGPPAAGTLSFSVRNAQNDEIAAASVAVGPGGVGSVNIATPVPGTYRVVVTYSGSGAFSTSGGIGSLSVTAIAPSALVVVGSPPGVAPAVVRVFNAETRALVTQFVPYPRPFRGGVRIAVGDVTGDGIPDIITAPGRGIPTVIDVFNSQTGALESRFTPFSPTYRGGARVAVATVVPGGPSDILVQKPGQRRVDIFDGRTDTLVGQFPGALLTQYKSGRFASHRGTTQWDSRNSHHR